MRVDGKIYADYQATTPIDPVVVEAMQPYYTTHFGNPHSTEHFFGWRASEAVAASAHAIAESIGAEDDEIVFTSGATESNNLALLGLARRREEKRYKVLIGATEHKSILAVGRELTRQLGLECITIPVSADGVIDVNFIEDSLDDKVLLVSVGAVNNEIGTIQSIEVIGKLMDKHGVYFHCDAAQALCATDLNVFDTNIDLLSLSAHKIYGPKGIGALYVKRSMASSVEPLMYGGGQQNGLRSGTMAVALCVGFAKAAEAMSQDSRSEERKRVRSISEAFLGHLQQLGVEFAINGSFNAAIRHPGNSNIRLSGVDSRDVIATLQPNVAISSGSACTSGTPESSYVLRAIGLSEEEAQSSLRVSFGRFSTIEDAKKVAEGIKMSIEDLRT